VRITGSGGSSQGAVAAVKLQAAVREQAREIIRMLDPSTMGSTALPPGVGENIDVKA
jgi:hypothetical protein